MFSKTAINCLYQNQCCRKALCILEWVLEQKKEISGKLDEIWLSLGVYFTVMCPCWFLSFDEHTFSSVQLLSRVWLFATPWTAAHQASCPSWTPGAYSNSCPLSRWWHPTVSSSVIPFSSHLQSSPASGAFQMSQFFTSGSQSSGVSASASIFPMNIRTDFL